jgi:hypothetical protein
MNSVISTRLSRMVNSAILRLALPSSLGPFRSMTYNWEAQKVLLGLIANLKPVLTINANSYRAVVRVLLASQRNEREAKVVTLHAETWPPWRIDQDGMDAQRSFEEDLSRSELASRRSQESGYRQDAIDQALKILAGMELDGTPTISTRYLSKVRRSVPRAGKADLNDSSTKQRGEIKPLSASLWAARIVATRDEQEAWDAFVEFVKRGGEPNHPLYFAMFRKLNYANAIPQRRSMYSNPGGGLEVRPVPYTNKSLYKRLSTLPPPLEWLYERMVKSGIRPQGRCLAFLVSHARTIDEGLHYLRDGKIEREALHILANGSSDTVVPALAKVPRNVFWGYLTLLCRFPLRRDPGIPTPHFVVATRNSVAHAGRLLRQSNLLFRPVWYALFKVLSKRGLLISRHLLHDDVQNAHKTWKVFIVAFNDFQRMGLELDPLGFTFFCQAFENFVTALLESKEHENDLLEARALLRAEFDSLSESHEPFMHIPRLLHSLNGAQLHAYVRALGSVRDHRAIFSAVEWMFKHEKDLWFIACETRNGHDLFRKVFLAVRIYLDHTEHAELAKQLVDQVEWWGGWPTDFAVDEYLEDGDWDRDLLPR